MTKLYLKACCVTAALLLLALQPAQAQQSQTYAIQQVSSGRLLQAESDSDRNVVTVSTRASLSHYAWVLVPQGAGIYTIMHRNTRGYLDAHEIAQKDFHLVTRPRQTFDSTQLWEVAKAGRRTFTIKQVSSGRYMDAHEVPELDYGVVSRPRQDNNTQLWILMPLP